MFLGKKYCISEDKIDMHFFFLFHILARVLVGNTTQGNSTMRVPPSGYDTTGDGQNIFGTFLFMTYYDCTFSVFL